jgi:NAD(P)-dependent dehydrogenase (short-subunit alcohol dehydrogenase family)
MSYIEKLFSLQNKIAIVTGSARGNGRAIAEGLIHAGATVVAVDILDQDIDCQTVKCDITDVCEITKLVDSVIREHGKIDILVNNAGISLGSDLDTYPDNLWTNTLAVNVTAPFRLANLVATHMKKRTSGSIINVTSLNAELAFPGNPAYMTSKGALKQLTKSLAYDLGQYGIRANNIGPGYIKTAMTEKSWNDPEMNSVRKNRTLLGRWGHPEDLIGAVIFLASDASSFVTGQDLYVDGGWLAKGL